MPIRRQDSSPLVPLSTTNEPTLIAMHKKPVQESPYYGLLLLLAELFDGIANGSSDWVSVGKNQAGDSYLLTYHDGKSKYYAGGTSLRELSEACKQLLEP